MENIEFSQAATKRKRGRSRPPRVRFGMVHYITGTRQAYLVIPPSSGIAPGDRIGFYIENGGVSFRVEKDGTYSVFKSGASTEIMRCALCPELMEYASFRTKDIICKKVDGGWFVPFSQFE